MKRKTTTRLKAEERKANRRRAEEEKYGRDTFLFGESDEDEEEEYYEGDGEEFDAEYAEDSYDDGAPEEDEDYYSEDYNSSEDEEYSDGNEYFEEEKEELPEFDPEDPDFFTRDLDVKAIDEAINAISDDVDEEDFDFENTIPLPVEEVFENEDEALSESEYEESEYYEEEYYEEDESFEEDVEDSEYYEEEYYEDDESFEDEYYEDEYYEDEYAENVSRKRGFVMSTADKLIALTGVCVLAIAVAAGVLFYQKKTINDQLSEFATIGSELDNINIIGEQGLNSAAYTREDFSFSEENTEEIDFVVEEPVSEEIILEPSEVTILLKATTIQSDIKIKFNNKDTGKLVAGVPFVVKVAGDNGKTYEWTDDDKDGIIHHTDVANGTYKITMDELDKNEFEKYIPSSETVSIKVTDKIEYKKVDVSDEVKTEAEVNTAIEDTAVKDTAVESVIKDTVEWVESTQSSPNGDDNEYQEIDKSSIVSPKAGVKNITGVRYGTSSGSWMMPMVGAELTTDAENGNTEEPKTDVADEKKTDVTEEKKSDDTEGNKTDVTEEKKSDETGEKKAEGDGSKTNDAASTTPSDTSQEFKASLSTTTVKGAVGGDDGKITVKPEGGAGIYDFTWEVADSSIVTLTADGATATLKYGAVGTTTIKITVATIVDNAIVTKELTCPVTVVANASELGGEGVSSSANGDKKIKLTTSSLTLSVDSKDSVVAAVSGTTETDIIWSSDDSSIASVDEKGNVTGVAQGSTVITATLKSDSTVFASLKVTVAAGGDLLKDNDGNQVYIKDSTGAFVPATSADYETATKFYIKIAATTDYKYTGWQTIDGVTYFYDKDGNYVTGEQTIQGVKYTFDSNGHLQSGSGTMGIDVSRWNGSIDWNAVRNSGVSYVIIRCGYRGSTSGALIEDPMFRTNISGAKAAGLQVGAYFTTQAVSEAEAVEEASMAVNLCGAYGLNLPLFLDVEKSGGRGDKIDADARTAVCKAFCQTVANSGYSSGIYANKTWFTSKMHVSQLSNYKIWLAQYSATPSYSASRIDYWQYSSKGSISGIKGAVDLNIRY